MGFSTFSWMFTVVWLLTFGIILVVIIRGLCQWGTTNRSPRLTVDVTIVSKRTCVSHHTHSNDVGIHTDMSTSYYVTFQVESGDRMELQVKGTEYGMLVEGDRGRLTFQGTRYLRFQRS